MQVFVIIKNVGIMINTDLNVNNLLPKIYVIHDLFGMLVNVNVINHVMSQSISIMKVVSVEEN